MNNFITSYTYVRSTRIKQLIKSNEIVEIYFTDVDKELENILSKYNIKINPSLDKNNAEIFENITYYIKNKNTKQDPNELKSKLDKLELELKRSKAILSNKSFITKASKEKIEQEKQKQKQYQEEYNELKKII
jgi:valyl-tRNA synthetase